MRVSKFSNMEVVPLLRWKNNKTGQTASFYGARPFFCDAGKEDWDIENQGFTVRFGDGTLGCYGLSRAIQEGRVDRKSYDSVQEWMYDLLENRKK